MPRSVLLRLTDIRDTINELQALTTGVSFEAFNGDWAMQRAVERGLEIVSEASRHIPAEMKLRATDIPWRQIAAIGNLLQHEYQRADLTATWNIVTLHLPPLAVAIQRLIAHVEQSDGGG